MRPPGALSAIAVCAAVLILEVACRHGLVNKTVILPPSEMIASLWKILQSGEFNKAIALTLKNVLITALISITTGFFLGVVLYCSSFLRKGVEPFLASYYAIPTFIFYPVFIVIFGVGSGAIIAIAVLLAIVAMITATLNGLDRIPAVFSRTAAVMRLSVLQRTTLIQFPASLPYLFTGARLSVAYSFIGVIASEFILSGDGVGYAISYAYNNFDNQTMYGLMLFIVVVVTLINTVLDFFDRRLQTRLAR